MAFCPNCKAEYRQGIETCPECMVKLVDHLETRKTIPENLKNAYVTNSPMVAEMIQGLLEQEGIASVLSNEMGSAILPVMGESNEIGILVPEHQLQETQGLIKAYFEDNPEAGDMILCGNCGARVEPNLSQCPYCGDKFEEGKN